MDILFALTLSVALNALLLWMWLATREVNIHNREKYDAKDKTLDAALKELYVNGSKSVTMNESGNFTYTPQAGPPA